MLNFTFWELSLPDKNPIDYVVRCHCRLCRKVVGATFCSTGFLAQSDFAITEGSDLVNLQSNIWNHPNPDVTRFYCGKRRGRLGVTSSKIPLWILPSTPQMTSQTRMLAFISISKARLPSSQSQKTLNNILNSHQIPPSKYKRISTISWPRNLFWPANKLFASIG